jgi:hypothetical protein
MVTNEHQYVTKMALNASMEGLWGDFIAIFWITKYLQRPIYIWNKVSKCIMSQCGMDFQNTNVRGNEILFNPFISIPLIKFLNNRKIPMQHSHLIVEPNVTLNK